MNKINGFMLFLVICLAVTCAENKKITERLDGLEDQLSALRSKQSDQHSDLESRIDELENRVK